MVKNNETKISNKVFIGLVVIVILFSISMVAYHPIKNMISQDVTGNSIVDTTDQIIEESPLMLIQEKEYDFGTIYQNEGIVQTTFLITNEGEGDLIISGLDTSCMCTTAKLVYASIEGPEFGMSMHGDNPDDYELKIASGETAELTVMYNPMAHGIQKTAEEKISRYVTIFSNDPKNPQEKVRIKLTQLK